MPLPLIIGGAVIAAAGAKVYKDTKEIEELNRRAEGEKREGDRYREKGEKLGKELKELGRRGQQLLGEGIEKGVLYLTEQIEELGRYGDLSIILETPNLRRKYLKFLMEEAQNLHLYQLGWGDIELLFQAVEEIGGRYHHHQIEELSISQRNVEEADVEAVASMFAHGIMSAGFGGAAALVGFEFLAATGVGAVILAPLVVINSSEKVDEARRNLERAREYREKAELNYYELEGKKRYLTGLVEIGEIFAGTIEQIIEIDQKIVARVPESPDLFDPNLGKHIITLAYLGKILKFNPLEGVGDLGELTDSTLQQWREERRRFRELKRELEELERAPVADVKRGRMLATAKELFFQTLQRRGVPVIEELKGVLEGEHRKLGELSLGEIFKKVQSKEYLNQLGERVGEGISRGVKVGRVESSPLKPEELIPGKVPVESSSKEEIVKGLLEILFRHLKKIFENREQKSFVEQVGELFREIFQFLRDLIKEKAVGSLVNYLLKLFREKILKAFEGFKNFLKILGRAFDGIREVWARYRQGEIGLGEFLKLSLRQVVFALSEEIGLIIEKGVANQVKVPGVGESVGVIIGSGVGALTSAFYQEVIEKYLFFLGQMSDETMEMLARHEQRDLAIERAIGELTARREEWEGEFNRRRWEIESQLTDNLEMLLNPELALQQFEEHFKRVGEVFGVEFEEEKVPELAQTLHQEVVTAGEVLKEREVALRRLKGELEQLIAQGASTGEIIKKSLEIDQLERELRGEG